MLVVTGSTTLRSTLTAVPNSKLALKFAKDDKSQTQQDTKPYFFDYKSRTISIFT